MITKNEKKLQLSKLSVADLLKVIEFIKPEFHQALHSLKLTNNEYNFYKASYKFGDKIIHDGNLYFTTENGESLSIDDPVIPDDVFADLNYNRTTEDPLAVFLNKTSEAYIAKNHTVIDSSLLCGGDFIGIPRALNAGNIARSTILNYEISAGCRSIFILSKISDRKTYQKISKTLGYEIAIPQSMEEHCQTFIEISNKQDFDWTCEVIFFPRNFINDLNQNKILPINLCLNNIHAKTYNMKHNHASIWNMLYFISIEKDKLLNKYNPQYLNIIKHIFMLCSNSAIGFIPATTNDVAPIAELTKFFRENYGLIDPIIMHPAIFNYKEIQQFPIYLSLNYQHVMLNAQDTNKYGTRKTNLFILNELKYIYGVYVKCIKEEKSLNNSILFDIVNSIHIDYFNMHNNIQQTEGLINLEQIIDEDSRFQSASSDLNIIKTSSFFNGGLRISKRATSN